MDNYNNSYNDMLNKLDKNNRFQNRNNNKSSSFDRNNFVDCSLVSSQDATGAVPVQPRSDNGVNSFEAYNALGLNFGRLNPSFEDEFEDEDDEIEEE